MHKTYPPQATENDCLIRWTQPGYFSPQGSGHPYCIVLPPPNVTGNLHMGHAYQVSLMDLLVRYYRMQGHQVRFQGGTDHAGISTQMVVEKQLLSQGKSRASIKREELLSSLSNWKEQSEKQINAQLRRLGASIDFERNRFTLDKGFDQAVRTVLIKLHEEGLLYRGKKLVNWDPQLMTAISDLEVAHTEEIGWLYYIRYPLVNKKGYLTIATTRPETLFGDAAIAVHPDDKRYQSLVGNQVNIPLTHRSIPVIKDTAVNTEFGTGCVKVTPAHDFNDYKMGERHQLSFINILTPKATLNENVPQAYQGMDCGLARRAVIKDLEYQDKLEKREKHTLFVPRGDRSGAIIEPYLTDQWFIHMKPLAQKAIEAIETKKVKFIPENWKNTCLQWLKQIEDWCISRQIWWGHRMPAWYNQKGEYFIGLDEVSVRARYNIPSTVSLIQDQDVLDTWVSAALWPFVTLGWPEKTEALHAFYPTSILVTAFDIIFFWVARMLMFGLHFTQQVPFKTVYITGLIRDPQGQKMSKSKGNGLDPLDIVEGISVEALTAKRIQGLMQPHMADTITKLTQKQFPKGIEGIGADALRMTCYALASPTRDIRFDMNRAVGYRNFCNKLWQVTRFVCSQHHSGSILKDKTVEVTHIFNRWILSRLQDTIQKTHQCINDYRFDHLTQCLYDFVWHDYCDWYVELVKPILRSEGPIKLETRYTLTIVLESIIGLLHPLIPFSTETLWLALKEALALGDKQANEKLVYPKFQSIHQDYQVEIIFGWLQQVIKIIRGLRNQLNTPTSQILTVYYATADLNLQKRVQLYQEAIEKIAKCTLAERSVAEDSQEDNKSIRVTIEALSLYIKAGEGTDSSDEIENLQKEKSGLQKEMKTLQNRLAHPGFISNAPKEIVQQSQKRLTACQIKFSEVNQQLLRLQDKNK